MKFFSILGLIFSLNCMSQSFVGKIVRSVGQTKFMGSGFLIDANSFRYKAFNPCEGEVYFITANHVIPFSLPGDTVNLFFPQNNTIYGGVSRLRVRGSIFKRDIESDLAIIKLVGPMVNRLRENSYCAGLGKKEISIDQKTILTGYPKHATSPNYLVSDIFTVGENEYLNSIFNQWLVVNQYSERGMSGGLLIDQQQRPIAMVFKKLNDADPIKKPLTLTVPIDLVGKRLKELLSQKTERLYSYLMESESIKYKGITFKELKAKQFQNKSLLSTTNIGAEGHNIGAEGHNIGAEGHDIGGLIVSRYSYGVEIVKVDQDVSLNITDINQGNNTKVLKAINGQSIESLAHLLKFIKEQKDPEQFDLAIDIVTEDGEVYERFLGDKDKELIHNLMGRYVKLKLNIPLDAPADEKQIFFDMYQALKEISLIIYANDEEILKHISLPIDALIDHAKTMKMFKLENRVLWREFRTDLYRLKSKYSGIENEYL